MARIARVGRNLIAYCLGSPIALAIAQFQQTLESIRSSGKEIWTMSDEAGIVSKDNKWYVWIKKQTDDEQVEGRIYENASALSVLETIYAAFPWLSMSERMRIVRQFRHASSFA